MKDWKKTLISPDTSIMQALDVIDKVGMQIAMVIDKEGKLAGTVTDGDIRRGILRGISLQSSINEVMYKSPKVAFVSESKSTILQKMKQYGVHHIPVLDDSGRIVNVEFLDILIQETKLDNEIILMAGGLGTRLRPLTENYPKPMLKIGGKPILETIIANFIEYGFYKFRISVNYMADQIISYFGDGDRWGVEIQYITETNRMGTAGALSLMEVKPESTFFVMNADLLTKVNFKQLLNYHNEQSAAATMCVRNYEYQVPYGVVNIENNNFLGLEEKPVQRFFINAGVYVLSPSVLSLVPKNEYFDMPMLFEKLVDMHRHVTAFPIREYWMDIGQLDDFNKANSEFSGIFG